MKRMLSIVVTLLVLCGLVRAGEPVGITTGTTNAAGVNIMRTTAVCVLPQRNLVSAPVLWTALSGSVVRASQIIQNSSGGRYYAVNSSGIAATNQPTHTSGLAVGAADGIAWQIYPQTHGLRTGLFVAETTTQSGPMWLSVGFPAETYKGVLLTSPGSALLIPSGAPQDAIFVISGVTNDAVVAQDW